MSTPAGRTPPWNLEAEQAVLSGCLLRPSAAHDILEGVAPEFFYSPAHRLICQGTDGLLRARQALSQLSYTPKVNYELQIINYECFQFLIRNSQFIIASLVGLGGLEPPTSRLSGVRSNHLSYRPLTSLYNANNILLFIGLFVNYYFPFFLIKIAIIPKQRAYLSGK